MVMDAISTPMNEGPSRAVSLFGPASPAGGSDPPEEPPTLGPFRRPEHRPLPEPLPRLPLLLLLQQTGRPGHGRAAPTTG